MTSSKIPVLALLVGLVLGIGIGFFAGHSTSSKQASMGNASSSGPLRTKTQAGRLEAANEEEFSTEESLKSHSATRPITSSELSAQLVALEQSGLSKLNSMRKYADLQDRLRASDVGAIAKEMISNPSILGRETGLNLVIATFAEKNLEEAWKLALNVKSPLDRQNAMWVIVSSIAAKDPSKIMAIVDEVQDQDSKRQLHAVALSQISSKDPARALELALKQDTNLKERDVATVFEAWARKDPEGAKAAVVRLSGRLADQARTTLALSLARKDPQAGWDYALSQPAANDFSQSLYMQIIGNWAQSDPQAALKAALTMPQSGARGPAISTAVSTWARNDFKGALQYAISIDDSTMRSDIFRAMSNSSSENHKELFEAVLDHMPPGDSFQQTVSGIFASWATENPAAAASALTQLPPGRAFSIAAGQIASQWMRSGKNNQEVFNWARQLPEGEGRRNAIQSVFSEWSSNDLQGALRVLDNVPESDHKQAVQALASSWSRKNPQAVLEWSSSLKDPAERNSVVGNAISQWAGSSPEAAARYVGRLPEENKSVAMQAVVNSWASKDTEAAAEWLRNQPGGTSKDAAVSSLSRKILQEDPETALAWAATISNESKRARQIEYLALDWIRQDATTARAWISKSQLPEETRKRLLQ